jgi:hypothetical protein
MAKDTFTINAARDERPGTVEIPYNAIAGWPYHQDQCAAMAVFNRTGSGKILTIVDFFVKDVSTPNSTTANANLIVQRISARTLGGAEEKTAADGYVCKFDSNNADLPSQVKFYEDVQSVTLSDNPLRWTMNFPLYNETRALAEMCSYLHGDKDSGLNNAELIRFLGVTGDVQPIIIREGEGICITPVNGLIYLTIKYWLNVFIRDASTGECYSCNFPMTPDGGRTSMIFVNDSGSGKVYQVFRVEIAEIGNDIPINLYSLEKIEGLDHESGDIILATPHDSLNGSLTNKIDCQRDCNVTIYGNKHGSLMSRPIFIRDWQTNQGGAPYASGTMNLSLGARNANFLNIRNQNSEIILREGEGVAMFKRTVSGIGKAAITLRFTVEDAVPAAGGNTYSRSRVVNV